MCVCVWVCVCECVCVWVWVCVGKAIVYITASMYTSCACYITIIGISQFAIYKTHIFDLRADEWFLFNL